MPQIIAHTIADQLADCTTEEELRAFVATALQVARSNGYQEDAVLRVLPNCLNDLHAEETNPDRRRNIERALRVIPNISSP